MEIDSLDSILETGFSRLEGRGVRFLRRVNRGSRIGKQVALEYVKTRKMFEKNICSSKKE